MLASAVLVGAAGLLAERTAASQIITTATADAELREITPEFTRGNTSNGISGTGSLELQISSLPNSAGVISSASSNRNIDVLRFHIPDAITSSADLQGHVELRLLFRPNSMNGTGGVRLYGLSPLNSQNTTWNEDNVMYRDAGDHQLVNQPIGNGQALTTPSVISQSSFPAAPIAAVAGYNADPNAARRAPGIKYENPPYSAQVKAENDARFTYNQTHTPALPYINQPAYNVGRIGESGGTLAVPNAISVGDGDPTTTADGFTDIYNDVPNSNRPFFSGPTQTWVDDLDTSANGYTFIGYSKVTFPANTGYAGQYISVGANAPTFPGTSLNNNTDPTDVATAETNLLAFVSTWLDLGYHDLTFMVGPSIGPVANGGTLPNEPINGANLQIASKEYTPTGGLMGDYAPELVLAPEPSVATIGALTGLFGLVRRRRRA